MTRPPCVRLYPACPGNPRCASRASRLNLGRTYGLRSSGLRSCKHNFTISRRVSPELCKAIRPESERAQGTPGACCTRGLACKKCAQKTHTSIQVQTEQSGIPCARETVGTKNLDIST